MNPCDSFYSLAKFVNYMINYEKTYIVDSGGTKK